MDSTSAKATNSEDGEHRLAHNEPTMRKPRAYQLEMFAEALRQNTIVAVRSQILSPEHDKQTS